MANPELYRLLSEEGVEAWNEFREHRLERSDIRIPERLWVPDLIGVHLNGADLRNANLANADLTDASLNNCDLRGANLTNARLVAARLVEADLSEATLTSADLNDATMTGVRLNEAVAAHANFRGAELNEAELIRATMPDTSFVAARLNDANLESCDLSGAQFINADCTGASFNKANVTNTIFPHATLRNSVFRDAEAGNANFTGADLADADFSDSNLRGGDYTNADMTSVNLAASDLSDARLYQTNLLSASFEGALVSGASLIGANITGANLGGAQSLTQPQIDEAGEGPPATLPEGIVWPGQRQSGPEDTEREDDPIAEDQETQSLPTSIQSMPTGAEGPGSYFSLIGHPAGSHLTVSSLGIGGGMIGVTAVFIPHKGNYAQTPEGFRELLGWQEAEDFGAGMEGLGDVLGTLRSDLVLTGMPESGLDQFIEQLRTEPWITYSASPLNSDPIPGFANVILRKKGIFGFSTNKGFVFLFLSFLGGAFMSGPVEDLGKGFFSEATGIEDFEKLGRDLYHETADRWAEVHRILARLPNQNTPTESPNDPGRDRHAIRPDETD
jgi:uncharacterized protein YjbI with pentapeptide repeats